MNMRRTQTTPLEIGPRFAGWMLLALLAAGAFLRLYQLDLASFRADTLIFWNICRQPVSGSMIFTHWMEWMGITGQFPFPMAWIKFVLDTLHLTITPFTLRLPSAIWGILTIPAAYAAGAWLRGRRTGLLLAAFAALQPMLIQATREAYYYPPMLLGTFLLLAGAVWLWRCLAAARPLPIGLYIVYVAGFFLTTWSQPAGWSTALLHGVVLVGWWGWLLWRKKTFHTGLFVLLALIGMIGLPLIFANWGLPQIRAATSESMREYARRVFGPAGDYGRFALLTLGTYGWGALTWRLAVTLIVACFGLEALVRRRKDGTGWLVMYLLLGGAIMFVFSQQSVGAALAPRYVIALTPPYLLLLAVGLDWLAERLERLLPSRAVSGSVLGALLVLPLLIPAWHCTQLRGKPTPYQDIVAWADANLPPGTPVLVDRWYEPWNELKIYPPTNVTFTFTIPNEPPDIFVRDNWRGTAQEYLRKNPDAAYLEIAREYWDKPGIGPWHWPATFFARRMQFRNDAGIALQRDGLLYRDEGGVYTNRLTVDLFYNTRADLEQRAHAEKIPTLALFGRGWTPVKLWPRVQDFRDWRVPTDKAEIDLYRAGPAVTNGLLRVRAAAAGGANLRVRASTGHENIFPAGRLMDWDLPGVVLTTGWNRVVLQVPGGPSALLTESVEFQEPKP